MAALGRHSDPMLIAALGYLGDVRSIGWAGDGQRHAQRIACPIAHIARHDVRFAQ